MRWSGRNRYQIKNNTGLQVYFVREGIQMKPKENMRNTCASELKKFLKGSFLDNVTRNKFYQRRQSGSKSEGVVDPVTEIFDFVGQNFRFSRPKIPMTFFVINSEKVSFLSKTFIFFTIYTNILGQCFYS